MAQDWFTANAPKPKSSGEDWFATNAPKKQKTPPPAPQQPPRRGLLDRSTAADFPVLGLLKGAANIVSGIPSGVVDFVTDLAPGLDADGTLHAPLERTITGVVNAHRNVGAQAIEAAKQGDYLTAARKGMNTLVPVLGPALDASEDKIARGDIAEGIGEVGTNVLLTAMGTQPKGKPVTVTRPTLKPPMNPAEAAAVDFAKREGIPLDAATATGSQRIRNVQKKVANSWGGGGAADAMQSAQDENLARVGSEQLTKASATPTNSLAAGERVRNVLTKQIEALHQKAAGSYDVLRAMEEAQRKALPTNPAKLATMDVTARTPLAVDITAAAKELQPLYNQLKREAELGIPMQGAKGRTLAALDGLMNGPNVAPLSVVDGALSDLKAMARGADMPELRTTGQATAAQAVQKLDAQVRLAAAKAGPNVLKALEEGRAATKQKYATADVLDMLSGEPGQVFRQLTQAKDVGLERLKAVQKLAPQEMPNIGRAFLEDAMQQATAEGGFMHADRLWSNWQKLGAETKRMLFKPAQIKDLDNYFLLAKKIKENPNPSGTAMIPRLNVAEAIAAVPAWALSKMLLTPGGVKFLTTARMASVNPAPATQALALSQLSKAAQSAGVPIEAIPALAGDPEKSTPSGKSR